MYCARNCDSIFLWWSLYVFIAFLHLSYFVSNYYSLQLFHNQKKQLDQQCTDSSKPVRLRFSKGVPTLLIDIVQGAVCNPHLHTASLLTAKSQNHRIAEVAMDVCRSFGPTALLKQDYLEMVAQKHIQMAFEYF